jgi:hypothetical protein
VVVPYATAATLDGGVGGDRRRSDDGQTRNPRGVELAGVEDASAVAGLVVGDDAAVAHVQPAGGRVDTAAVGCGDVAGDGHRVEDEGAVGQAVDAAAVFLGEPVADREAGERDLGGCLVDVDGRQDVEDAVALVAVDDRRTRAFARAGAPDRHRRRDVQVTGGGGVLARAEQAEDVGAGGDLDDVGVVDRVGLLDRGTQRAGARAGGRTDRRRDSCRRRRGCCSRPGWSVQRRRPPAWSRSASPGPRGPPRPRPGAASDGPPASCLLCGRRSPCPRPRRADAP